jgi:hypothetical protein
LTDGERSIVEAAVSNDGPYVVQEGEDVPDGLSRLAARLRDHGHVPEYSRGEPTATSDDAARSGQYLVRYQGDVYWTTIYLPDGTDTSGT